MLLSAFSLFACSSLKTKPLTEPFMNIRWPSLALTIDNWKGGLNTYTWAWVVANVWFWSSGERALDKRPRQKYINEKNGNAKNELKMNISWHISLLLCNPVLDGLPFTNTKSNYDFFYWVIILFRLRYYLLCLR